ncbi:hypothetical protein [Streptomyces puniciscabiei]|uniref:hypothetical protein n=1 Tax=Streptomyces puniciscabiei TaxID=164348 RepID=UPI00114DDA05|nr:hypothetical protein [Streptomyces puniciscabiei]
MDAHNADAEPFAASPAAYRLLPESDGHNDAGVRERAAKRVASWNGRAVIVAISVATVILAVVSVVVHDLPR